MILGLFEAGLEFGSKLIDKIFPDPTEKEKAKVALLEMQQNGELAELTNRYAAIVEEAKSEDPWTSRARPSFLYVIYILLLSSLPFGIFYVFDPQRAALFVAGFQSWFEAIPEALYALFGAGYLGYSGVRSYDKRTSSQKDKS